MTKCCLKKNWPNATVCINELKVFIAIMITSGYKTLPSKAMHWFHDHDVYNEAVSSAKREDRFDMLKKCLHFNATDMLDKSEKYCQLRPLISHLQNKFMKQFIPSQEVSHDGAMVKYFGKNSCKQSNRKKTHSLWVQDMISKYSFWILASF